jgi:hypothetical protein
VCKYVARWLRHKNISRYFDDHLAARDAIVAAVHDIAGRNLPFTPALTPSYNRPHQRSLVVIVTALLLAPYPHTSQIRKSATVITRSVCAMISPERLAIRVRQPLSGSSTARASRRHIHLQTIQAARRASLQLGPRNAYPINAKATSILAAKLRNVSRSRLQTRPRVDLREGDVSSPNPSNLSLAPISTTTMTNNLRGWTLATWWARTNTQRYQTPARMAGLLSPRPRRRKRHG